MLKISSFFFPIFSIFFWFFLGHVFQLINKKEREKKNPFGLMMSIDEGNNDAKYCIGYLLFK